MTQVGRSLLDTTVQDHLKPCRLANKACTVFVDEQSSLCGGYSEDSHMDNLGPIPTDIYKSQVARCHYVIWPKCSNAPQSCVTCMSAQPSHRMEECFTQKGIASFNGATIQTQCGESHNNKPSTNLKSIRCNVATLQNRLK